MKRGQNNLVVSTFWWHSGLFWSIAHIQPCNPIHLCQIKVGMERNTTPNDLSWNAILKLRKIQIITYIHDQNEFLAKISPKPTKTAVKTIYIYIYNYYTQSIEKHMQNIKWLVKL